MAMTETRKAYTEADDAKIKEMAKQGDCIREIARRLGRTYDSLAYRARYRGIAIKPMGRREPDGADSTYVSGHGVDWRAMAWDRLAWTYGPDQADRIQSGKDPRTQADLTRWRGLGHRSAA